MTKRRWWLDHERFRKVYRRLRRNYDQALGRSERKLREEYERKLQVDRNRLRQYEREYAEKLLAVASEVARIRLEFGPAEFTTRFTMYATFDERMMRHSHDLKTIGPIIVEMLSHKIAREFSQIDFGRAKPVDTGPDPRTPPRWRIEV